MLQALSKAGLISSKPGLGGGYALAELPKNTSILDVVNAVDPVRRITGCPLGHASHRIGLCPLHKRLDKVYGMVERELGKATLAGLLAETDGLRCCSDDAPTKRPRKKKKSA